MVGHLFRKHAMCTRPARRGSRTVRLRLWIGNGQAVCSRRAKAGSRLIVAARYLASLELLYNALSKSCPGTYSWDSIDVSRDGSIQTPFVPHCVDLSLAAPRATS